MATFPLLYGESSHKKRKIWSVHVEERADGAGVIVTGHGYEDGKQVLAERVVSTGKNLGRKNATTPLTQAISEAQALWNKKRDAGYTEDATRTESEWTPPLPMLAHDFTKRGKDIRFPCFAQRKLDGVRCVAVHGKGLFSRNGKPMSPHLEHIAAALPAGVVLDGELYSDTLTFQEIVGLVKKQTLAAGDDVKVRHIYLCVYDLIDDGTATNAERLAQLQSLVPSSSESPIRLLSTDMCDRVEDLHTLHARYVAEGYEGIMLRNKLGKYAIGHRSVHLQKYKAFLDAEYTVVDFKEGDGSEKGCVIWICETDSDKTRFAVRPRGTHEERQTEFANAAARVGLRLTVRYQELTDDGLPRFPVGIAFREYE